MQFLDFKGLSEFLKGLFGKFSEIGHKHTTSDITDYVVDSSLSSTSTNPLQNKVINEEFDAVSEAMGVLEAAIDEKLDTSTASSTYETKEDAQLKYDELKEIKPDWNENDSAAPDYIKNRTHWVEKELKTIVEETTETEIRNGDIFFDYVGGKDDEIHSNKTYIVTVDGVSYSCVPYYSSEGITLGNSELLESDSNVNNLPFAVTYTNDYDGSGFRYQHQYYVYYPDSETHTIKIEEESGDSVYHPLDEKYIPDTIARQEYVDSTFAKKSDVQDVDLSNYYTKEEIDNLELITVDDIDTICGASIQYASDVTF